MSTALFSHPDCRGHDTGPGHPERSARLAAVEQTLQSDSFAALRNIEAPKATPEQLALVHPKAFVDQVIAAAPSERSIRLDPDTVMSPGSLDASLRATGAVIAAIDAVGGGQVQNAFCAVRPPGHHAEPDRAMGFCIFNSIAIGAHYARQSLDLQRVAVIDFDVHHGNGTQAAFWQEPDLFYFSSHQYPFYPGTGAENERGQGNIVNAPLPAGSGSAAFRKAFERQILPALNAAKPEFVLVSAGFDAHHADPLAAMSLDEADFEWVTETLLDVAAAHAQGRLVSVLEGGYDLDALSHCVAAHVSTMMT